MQLKATEKTDTNNYKLSISVDGEQFSAAVDKALRKNAKKMTVKGFRKGKAPISVIRTEFGNETFFEEAFNDIYPDVVEAAVKEAGLDLAEKRAECKINEITMNGVEFDIIVTVKPEVKLGNYKGIKVTRQTVEITDDDLEDEIVRVRERNARVVTIEDRPAQNGDMTVIDFEGFVDGKAFEGGKGADYSLEIGSGQFIPGFEEEVIGHNTDDEFDVNVTFPEDYQEKTLAGKPAVFKVKLHEIKARELPELDDEFVKDVSEFDTLDEYKKDLTEKLTKQKEHEADDDVENQIVEAVFDNFEAEIPACMIEEKIDNNIEEFAYRLQSQGLNFKDYIKYTGMSYEDIREKQRESAERSVKLRLALEKIAKDEALDVTEEELEAKYAEMAESYKTEVDKIKAAVAADDLKMDMRCEKAINLLKELSVNE